MTDLSVLDFAMIAVYFIALILIGYFTSRKQRHEDYLIAERRLGTWATMATMNASKTGSILMTFVALTYLWGFSAVWYFMGVVTGALIFIPFAIVLKKESKNKFYTLADYFRTKYGKIPALFASSISIFLMFGLGTINLIGGTKIFVFFTGWPFWACAIIMAAIILIYLWLGGFKAVARTDILQYIAMIFILAMLTLILFNGSMIPTSDWNFFKADLGTIIGFFIIGVMFPFASPDLWQRVYSAKGKKELRNGLILSVGIYAFMAFLLALVALTVKAQFPNIDPDLALIYGFGNLLPPGLLGLSTVLLFAAIMSSLDTYIFTGAAAVVQDFFHWPKKKIVRNIKRVILLIIVISTLIAIAIRSLVLGSYIFVAFYSVLAIPVIATWINKRIKARTIVLGFSLGIAGTIMMLVATISQGEITPTVVLAAIGSTLFGLFVGMIVSFFKK